MSTTSVSPPALPKLSFVRPEDIKIGAYLADIVNNELYCVLDLRRANRNGRSTRLAMLENALTDEIEAWEFGRIAGLRLVPYERTSEVF